MGAPALTRRGVAYRHGLKRWTPRRSEGSRSLWFRTDQFADVQFELVLQDSRLAGRSSCRIRREATRTFVVPSTALEEVTPS